METKIAYLGPKGTFGEEAANIWNPDAIRIPFPSHLRILDAVNNDEAQEGIVAVENSIDGSVTDVIDYFIHEAYKIRVCGEIIIPINQCLFVKSGVKLQDVKVVISHPKGLRQCIRNIYRTFPNARQLTVEATAEAVNKMLAMDIPAVAIAGKMAAQPGAVIVQENFQDRENNTTRFWVIGQHIQLPTGNDKTSLAFQTFENAPGALVSVLNIFALRGLNLTKIESRPTKEAMGEYVFLVDVEAHAADNSLREVIKTLETHTPWYRIFGSYPKWSSKATK